GETFGDGSVNDIPKENRSVSHGSGECRTVRREAGEKNRRFVSGQRVTFVPGTGLPKKYFPRDLNGISAACDRRKQTSIRAESDTNDRSRVTRQGCYYFVSLRVPDRDRVKTVVRRGDEPSVAGECERVNNGPAHREG